VKQYFERLYNESNLFYSIFRIELQWSSDGSSAFATVKAHERMGVNPISLAPLAAGLEAALLGSGLQTICNVVGWLADEYIHTEPDDEDSIFVVRCREFAARLLTESIWTFVDKAFESDISRSISKVPITLDSLRLAAGSGDDSSPGAHPSVERALELLAMFDQCMPKERSVRRIICWGTSF
jgi:hypothetical protein